jgi:hypothetical protein
MVGNRTHLSLHDRRVRLIANAARAHSNITEEAAFEIATHAAHALNHIPKKMRVVGMP